MPSAHEPQGERGSALVAAQAGLGLFMGAVILVHRLTRLGAFLFELGLGVGGPGGGGEQERG